jgi:hypothetical protein
MSLVRLSVLMDKIRYIRAYFREIFVVDFY